MADTVVDTLSLEVISEVQNAEDGINRLITGLTGINQALTRVSSGGIKKFSNAIDKLTDPSRVLNLNIVSSTLKTFVSDMNNIGGVTFDVNSLSNLIASINKIGGVKATQATQNLPKISADLMNFIQQINSLGTAGNGVAVIQSLSSTLTRLGGKATTTAITNIPLLATALSNLMQTLSSAPTVSNNIIEMTNALANLAAQGSRVGSASNSINRGFNSTSNTMSRTRRQALSLAAAFGKLYANYFLLIRAIKALGKATALTSDYIEAYNYYNVVAGKIGSETAKAMGDYGEESAKEYAEGFTTELNKLFGELSGQKVDLDLGLIVNTDKAGLGLDLQKLTQFASNISAVGNSMKFTGQATLTTAKAMSMLVGDLSSLKNIDIDEVMGNLTSGLLGQSRALYKYGIDITNATLQQYAYNLGIEKSISVMSQGEKAQLRMIAILDQSKVAWGDLANTLNTPSNQLRQLRANVTNLGRTIGAFFIPILSKVLPILNGFAIAVQRALTYIAQLFGIKLDFDAFSQGYSDIGESIEDVSDAYDDATDSAKKFRAQVRGWDEVNNLTSKDNDSGNTSRASGMLDLTNELKAALTEYESKWYEAFGKMENKAEEFADKIEKHFEPIKKLFSDIKIGDWFAVGKDVSDIVSGIFDFFSDAISKVDWTALGEKTGEFLRGIDWTKIFISLADVIAEAIDAAVGVWFGSLKEAPFETALITAMAVWKFTNVGKSLATKIGVALAAKGISIKNIGIKIAAVTITWAVGFDIGKEIGKLLFPENKEYYDNFKWFGEGGFFETIFPPEDDMKEHIRTWVMGWGVIGDYIDEMWNQDIAPWFTVEKWKELFDNSYEAAKEEWDIIAEWWKSTTLVKWWEEDVKPWFTKKKWKDEFDNAISGIKSSWNLFDLWHGGKLLTWWNKVKSFFKKEDWTFSGIKEGLETAWTSAVEAVKGIWNVFADWLNSKLTFELEPIVVMGKTLYSGGTITLGKIPAYEMGGFVPDNASLFMAGERGIPELLGTVGGKTAVAGGAEITGISNTIYDTSQQEMALMREEISLLRQLLAKPTLTTGQVFKATQQEANSFKNRTGRPAFA